MASRLPTFPRVVFTIFEPISLVGGALGAILDPAWFLEEQISQEEPRAVTENGVMVTWQLGNLYLLMAFMSLAILKTTSEAKVVRSYLVALWLGDIGHVAFTCYGLGMTRLMAPASWNAMAWGNIAVTVFLFVTRSAYFLGVFGQDRRAVVNAKKTN